MRVFWIILLVLFLLGQLITFLESGKNVPGIGAPLAGSADLIDDLVGETREVWQDALAKLPEPVDAHSGIYQDGLLEREQLMMELRDAETSLAESGCEIHIAPEVASWLSSTDHTTSSLSAHIAGYLLGLRGWLSTLSASGEEVSVERSFLVPGSSSEFPCVSFELKGPVYRLGLFLLDFENRFARWQLDELDLIKGEQGAPSWLRGSFVYRGEGL